MHRGARFKKMTTKRSKASPSDTAATIAQAFKVKTLNYFMSTLAHTYTIFSGCIGRYWNIINNFSCINHYDS
jgi:hypothetical protein